MRRTHWRYAAAVLVAAALAGCGGTTRADGHEQAASARSFVELANRGVKITFNPLVSPGDALAKGDLVVRGTLAGVAEGIGLRYPDRALTEQHAGFYATFVVEVGRVISGDPGKVRGGRVYVAARKYAGTSIAELAAANPRPEVIAVLDDITTWAPNPAVQVVLPAVVPPGAPLYAPYTDGLWLQASGDPTMYGLGAKCDDLPAAWGAPRTVEQYAAALEDAAAHR